MLSAADNALLTRTGADTPMGALFRRYWMPVALSRELPDNATLRRCRWCSTCRSTWW